MSDEKSWSSGMYQMDADEQRSMRKALEASTEIVGATDNHRLEQQRRLLDRIAELQAENERLKAGGCARDQRTTQYCAEAIALAKESEQLREKLARARVDIEQKALQSGYEQGVAKGEAENERLRDAWQPIETAPTDGTEVLLYTERGLRRIGFFDQARGGVWSIWPGRGRCCPPLWQPLPAPPQ